ncbi:MAG: MFS transporter [Ignavibacteriales bacterium]|nr:MFS transporter [Ignavibacteriales bacterium]
MMFDDKRAVLVASTTAAFLTPLMASSVSVALPSIGREFAMDALSVSWVATSAVLAAAMFLVPFGRLADIYGRKRIFNYGVITFTIFSFLSGIAPTGATLIASRLMQGMGAAMIFGTSVALLTLAYPPADRGRVLGINVAGTYTGLSLGPFIGGFLTQHFGWRSIFFLNAILGLLIIVLVMWRLKSEWAEAGGEKFDIFGSLLYMASLTALMIGFSKLPGSLGVWGVCAGLGSLLGFVLWEKRTPKPLLDIKLFARNPVFTFSNIAALINYSATSAVTFLVSFYLQYIKALSPQTAGLILVAQPIMMALFSPLAGRLSDSVEPRVVASIGMSIIAVGLGLLAMVGRETSTVLVTIYLLLLGFGFALFSSPNTNAIMSSVEKKLYGVASAMFGTMRLTGQMLSMGIVMLIFAVAIGNVQITPEYYPMFLQSMQISFVVFSALCVFGVFASLARGKVREDRQSTQ